MHLYPSGQGLDAHLPPGLAQPGTEDHVLVKRNHSTKRTKGRHYRYVCINTANLYITIDKMLNIAISKK